MKEFLIDLSDNSRYPAKVLSNLNYHPSWLDDDENFICFLREKWQQPKFHWGWYDYTHEDAVKNDFLYIAISAMNEQYRDRRDAMIASEGGRFVWLDQKTEPVQGLLSGEEFCDYMNRSLQKNLASIKRINEYDDREDRRWRLNPTYEDLMADWEKNGEENADYRHIDLGCGMRLYKNWAWGNRQMFLVNTTLRKVYPISDFHGNLVGFTHEDIDWDDVERLRYTLDAKNLKTSYFFGIEKYEDGIARVVWTLYPEGSYFADEHGFGMENNEEVNVCAYIDTKCRVLIKFQDMEDRDKAKSLYNEAYKKLYGKDAK